jgi:chaperone modulatory protein CbpM
MRVGQSADILTCQIIEDGKTLTLAQLCRSAGVHAEWVTLLVEEGVLEPERGGPGRWEFTARHLPRIHTALRLQRDLGLNVSGIAMTLELMDEIQDLRARLDAVQER